MAELAASLVVGPLVSLVKEKVSNYLLDQYKVMEGMEKQHKILKRKLPAILDIIADAEKQASHREGVKAWLEELKTAAYEANDVFDEFQYEALRRKAKEQGHITKLGMAGVKLFPTHNRVAFRNRMGNKLSTIVETIEVLVAEMNAFGFKHQLEGAPARKEWRETDSNIVDAKDIVRRSRDKEKKKIVDILLLSGQATSDGDLMVVPIVGMGGLGKTTLAQLIYNDPQVLDHFQLLKWVCVSDDFNVRDLANKICNASETSLEEALKKLQDELKGKRYLLVLDDIWNKDVDKWEKLKACLKHGDVGSAVLTTTRDKGIAEFMGTIADSSWANKYHDVSHLGKEFIQEIIVTRAMVFSLPKSKHDELVELAGLIAERCDGSPLAAKALGSVLRNKTTKQEWEDVLQRSSICSDETGILPILKLSYDDLPTNMKQCFAFCALYPKDYEIDIDTLIQLWMANGFISDQKKVPVETVGERIVREMVSRSFFEYVNQGPTRYGFSSTTRVKIHDLMHDVALSASEKECVYITKQMIENSELLPSVARHIHCQQVDKQRLAVLIGSMRNMPIPIQTLMFGDLWSTDVQDSSKYISLRALAVPSLDGNFLIKSKHMCHLRYLDLSHSGIKALPDDITILYNLQTLKLSGCDNLSRLPNEMKYMTGLRHLYTDGCYMLECMPPELGRLTSLRRVTCFVVGDGSSNCSNLGELKDLDIGGSLELERLENVAEASFAKAADFRNKEEVRQLSLRWTGGKEEEKQCQEVLEAVNAHDGLLALEISFYQGASFPHWMSMLKNMVELRLSGCRKTKQLPPLCQLPELQVVRLEGLERLQFLCSRCTSSTFGKLKDLKLVHLDDLGSLFPQAVEGGAVAFPKLEILDISHCKNLAALPEAAVLREPPYGGGARSAFPELKSLTLSGLSSFERWAPAAQLEIDEAEVQQPPLLFFPMLETARIERCPRLTSLLPRAPKLRELRMDPAGKQLMSQLGAARDMTSVSILGLTEGEVDDGKVEKWDHLSSVTAMELDMCEVSFFQSSHALALWACFGQLQDLSIWGCDKLVYWPEEAFGSLGSLRSLAILKCDSLIGYAAPPPDHQLLQATSSSESSESRRRQLLPRLESLRIFNCRSLEKVFNAASALKRMELLSCHKLVSLSGSVEDNNNNTSVSSSSLSAEGPSTDDINASAAVVLSDCRDTIAINLLPSSLECLLIGGCHSVREVLSLPSSLGVISIVGCPKLRSLSGQLDALKHLQICDCPELRSLEACTIELPALEALYLGGCRSLALSLPSGRGTLSYSSLRRLSITGCPGIKSALPSALRQRLDSLEYESYLDARHLQGRAGLLGRIRYSLSPSRAYQAMKSAIVGAGEAAATSSDDVTER